MISFAIFLRRELVERVGDFDERLGLGAGSLWSSGEEVEYLVRALRAGARIEYDPTLTVTHPVKRYTPAELRGVGLRDGASVGWILRRHGYGARTTARMLLRPLGGVGASLVHGDRHARVVPRGDVSRPRPRLPGRALVLTDELGEDRGVAIEPLAQRKALDGPSPGGGSRTARARRATPETAAANACADGGSSRSNPS